MVIVPLSKPADDEENVAAQHSGQDRTGQLLRYAAAGTLLTGGALFLGGCRRSGLLAAVVGTALAMIDQQDTVRVWWGALPVYLDEAHQLLTRVQGAMDDVSAQQQKLRQIFTQASQKPA
jgi:hypothetical protein